jgi:hypothetical protein
VIFSSKRNQALEVQLFTRQFTKLLYNKENKRTREYVRMFIKLFLTSYYVYNVYLQYDSIGTISSRPRNVFFKVNENFEIRTKENRGNTEMK